MDGQFIHRIHITGGPGSGKTTLARLASARLGVPFYELDVVGYEGGAGADRPMDVRLADIHRIAIQPAWVTEGVFLGWTSELFETAAVIVWLDLPWRLVAWRIFMRHVRAELRGNNRHPGWLKLYRFMRWCRAYYVCAAPLQDVPPGIDLPETRATTEHYLAGFKNKLVRCASPAEVRACLARL